MRSAIAVLILALHFCTGASAASVVDQEYMPGSTEVFAMAPLLVDMHPWSVHDW